jgi:site-specific recombinase XerD
MRPSEVANPPGRDRVVYLTPRLVAALQHYLQQCSTPPAEDHVFLLRGRSPSARTLQRRLAGYVQEAGIVDVTPHRLRHTFATRLLNQGLPIHSLKKLLGHQNLDTTQIYARLYDNVLYHQFKEAMSQIEGVAVELWPGVTTDNAQRVATVMSVLD